jgi:hypothetical protein
VVTPGPTPGRPRRTVAVENRRPGTDAWNLATGQRLGCEGFAATASTEPGERIALHLGGVDGDVTTDVEWYRLGWYGGAGGRLLHRDRSIRVARGAPAVRDATLGRAEAPWAPALSLEVPKGWASGMHVAVLRPRSGGPAYVPFVVRTPLAAQAPILFVSAMTTWHAYDGWGGKSLYGYNSGGDPSVVGERAAQVSFDRPYLWDRGAGFLRRWELQFVRWLERRGYDADYVADVDLALHPETLAGRRLVIFAGHPEYWSRTMRDAVQRAVDAGTSVAFLTANEVYWSIRLEDSPLGPARRVTCYKVLSRDPVAKRDPRSATVRWRERPLLEPEARLVGQMYGHVVARPADWVVAGARHWLYRGTGVRDGDRFVNLVGQEYDTFFPALAPAGTDVLARSPVQPVGAPPGEVGDLASPPVQTATMYTARSGATVFAAGTFQWSWAIDDYGDRAYHGVATPLDARVERMTRNLVERLGRE